MGLRHSTQKSFYFAFQGLITAIKREPNIRIHFVAAVLALTLGAMLELSATEWLLLSFVIFYVITLELLNTVLESIVNFASPKINPYAKIAKDVSAACVLLAAMLAVIVGTVLFLPKIVALM